MKKRKMRLLNQKTEAANKIQFPLVEGFEAADWLEYDF
jgi:hypothetical protein